jgi:septum formation protein
MLTAPEVDETPLSNEPPAQLVQRLSRSKAEAILTALVPLPHPAALRLLPDAAIPRPTLIVAADTIVVSQGKILGKPDDPNEARRMLQALRAAPHQVYTGLTVVLLPSSETLAPPTFISRLHQSTVTMRPYTDAEIDIYVASGDPLDKAGAYGIQSQPFAPVAHLEGCFASVMGFPLGEFAAALQKLGLTPPSIVPRCTQLTAHFCCRQHSLI